MAGLPKEKLASLEKAVAAEKKKISLPPGDLASLYERNARVRRIHQEIEMARYDAIDQGDAGKETIAALDRLSDGLCLVPLPEGPAVPKAARMILVALFLIVSAPLMTVMSATRVLHGVLRLCGVGNNRLPLDIYQRWLCRGIVRLMGVSVVVEGADGSQVSPTIGFFTHSSNLDPPLVAASSLVTFRWIGKTAAFMIPVLGWFAFALGMIPIDRKNRTRAIASLERAGNSIARWRRSIAIAPEGTRSTTGLLLPFKKGPFHLAGSSPAPVSPVVLFGAYELWPPGRWAPESGQVLVRFAKAVEWPEGRPTDGQIASSRKHILGLLSDSPASVLLTDKRRQSFSRFADGAFVIASGIASYGIVWAAAEITALAVAWWNVEWV